MSEVVLTVQEIRPGKTDGVREQFAFTDDERDALADQLREEGISIESAFVHEREDADYFYSYIKAEDFDAMLEEWRESDEEAAVAYKTFLDEHMVGGWEQLHVDRAETIFHIEVPGFP